MVEHNVQPGHKTKRIPIKTRNDIDLISVLYTISIFRSFIKWIVRLVSGTCELQRIVAKCKPGVRTVKLEECMYRSRHSLLRTLCEAEPDDLDASIKNVMALKGIVDDTNPRFFDTFKCCLEQIYGFDSLYCQVENLRMEAYDSKNKNHEEVLYKLWNLLQPDQPLESRISHQWGDIGFQGVDPKTDFRGMGMLGLQNLVYFAEKYTDLAKQVLLHSQHPQHGYPYAIVGINITNMVHEFMCNGLLRSHFYNRVEGRPSLDDFQEVFCYLCYEFDKFWIKSEPENVMAFGRIREEFKKTVKVMLQLVESAVLAIDQT
ncbi:unnamed protein product [Clavelina lepadiformis]|uniref:ELMO domain-containing protein n=1 Tax=Clavelina lepadiformis TaxID=159417 RepID=A0ABP0FVS2_CLALP